MNSTSKKIKVLQPPQAVNKTFFRKPHSYSPLDMLLKIVEVSAKVIALFLLGYQQIHASNTFQSSRSLPPIYMPVLSYLGYDTVILKVLEFYSIIIPYNTQNWFIPGSSWRRTSTPSYRAHPRWLGGLIIPSHINCSCWEWSAKCLTLELDAY